MERLNRPLRKEWLAAYVFRSFTEVREQVDLWINGYNYHRPHESLESKAPFELRELVLENANFE